MKIVESGRRSPATESRVPQRSAIAVAVDRSRECEHRKRADRTEATGRRRRGERRDQTTDGQLAPGLLLCEQYFEQCPQQALGEKQNVGVSSGETASATYYHTTYSCVCDICYSASTFSICNSLILHFIKCIYDVESFIVKKETVLCGF